MQPAQPAGLSPTTVAVGGGTPEQQRFQHLVQRIQAARERLQHFEREVPLFAQAHARTLRPLQLQWLQARRHWLLALDVLVDDRGWTRAEREALRHEICHGALELLQAADDAELRALHDRHAEWPLPAAAPLPGRADDGATADTGEDPWADAAQRRREAASERRRQRKSQRPPPAGADTAVSASAMSADDARRSVRDVFRKVASALHPDRESDPARHAHKTALMQRANQAHAGGDLLTLLELQRGLAGTDADLAAAWSDDRLRAVNQALGDQLAALDREAARQSAHLAASYGLPDRMRPDPLQWQRWLDQQAHGLQTALAEQRREMLLLGNRQAMKRWLKGRA